MKNYYSHSFGNTDISGPTRLHQGDNHYHFHEGWSQEDKYATLYQSLGFEGIDTRARNVERALLGTCTWLRSHEHFLTWKDPTRVGQHKGLLWIKGKPGCGKSTIVKEALEWMRNEWRDQTILVYFFNARAPGVLEKSSLGLYRSLFHQLLSQHGHLQPLFAREFFSKVTSRGVQDWQEVELQNFLLKLLSNGHLPTLNIFVDALDEGDETDVQNMLHFFAKAADYAQPVRALFRLCLSSRHYPEMNIDTELSIVVENQPGHLHDIKRYIDRVLPVNNNTLMQQIRATLLQKSQGIFLWIVLTISLLKPLYRRGRTMDMMKELQTVPSGLRELFSKIVQHEDENREEFVVLLRWMLVAEEALTSTQLYHAIQAQCAPTDLKQALDIDDTMIDSYILNCSHGLIEITEDRAARAQFIHETVRQFLMEIDRSRTFLSCDYFILNLQPETCHATVAEGCLNYLQHVCKHDQALSSRRSTHKHALTQYAAKWCWRHMQKIDDENILRSLGYAEQLLTHYLYEWIQVSSRYWNRDYYSTHQRDNTDNALLTPLYYASYTGVPKLTERFIFLKYDVNVQEGYYGNPLQVAATYGHENVVRLLINAGANVNAQGGYYGNALHAATFQNHGTLVRILLDAGADINAERRGFGTALQIAAIKGNKPMLQIFLDAEADINSQKGHYGNPLHAVVVLGEWELVQMFFKAGIDRYTQTNYDDALHVALVTGQSTLAQKMSAYIASLSSLSDSQLKNQK